MHVNWRKDKSQNGIQGRMRTYELRNTGRMDALIFELITRLSGDVIRRTRGKNFNAVSHNRVALNVISEFNMAEARLDLGGFHLNVHSVTGNMGDTE